MTEVNEGVMNGKFGFKIWKIFKPFYNDVTDTNSKEVRQQVQCSKNYQKSAEFCCTLVTKLLNFNNVDLDSAVHSTKTYVSLIIFCYTSMYQVI